MNDNVKHPGHYTVGDIEVIDYIRDKLTPAEFTGYCIGNVIKYVSRWRHKGGTEDLRKAEVYLNWAIDNLTEDVNYDISESDTFKFKLTKDEEDACDLYKHLFGACDGVSNIRIEIHTDEED